MSHEKKVMTVILTAILVICKTTSNINVLSLFVCYRTITESPYALFSRKHLKFSFTELFSVVIVTSLTVKIQNVRKILTHELHHGKAQAIVNKATIGPETIPLMLKAAFRIPPRLAATAVSARQQAP